MEIEKAKAGFFIDMEDDDDLYKKMKDLEEEIEFIDIQEEFIKSES